MKDITIYLLIAAGIGYAVTQSDDVATAAEQATNEELTDSNNATGGNVDVWADRADQLSDAVDDEVRNEERFVGVPTSPYQ